MFYVSKFILQKSKNFEKNVFNPNINIAKYIYNLHRPNSFEYKYKQQILIHRTNKNNLLKCFS